ncbi:MAG: ABC transporter permease [Vicinamibacterales bacterium]
MGLWQDIQFALRLLIKDKWFALVAIVALALGIGVNATVFTFVNAVLIRGLPIAEPDRVLSIGSQDIARNRNLGVSYLDFRDLTEATKTFDAMGAWSGSNFNLSDEGKPPERYSGLYISANGFKILGQPVILGRDFVADDDKPGAASVVIIGGGVWKNRYGSDPNVIGRTVRINDNPSVVIGVMPEGFKFPAQAEVWLPLSQVMDLLKQPRNARGLQAFGHLAPDVSIDQARAELVAIGQRLATTYQDTNKDIRPRVQTFNELMSGGPIRAVFLSLMGAVAFVLLIACANVANLLLARSAARAREISVRVSLGASRWRIVRQLLIESLLVALASGVLGLLLANAGIKWFDSVTQDAGKPYWMEFTMDGSVIAFFAAVCLGTAIVFGLAPALHVSKTDVSEVLKEGGRSGSAGVRVRRWTGALIIVELALTVVLLAGAGFMMRNFLTMYRMDLGIETAHLTTMSLALPDRKYPSLEQRLAFYDRLQQRLQRVPNVRAVTVVSNIPLQGGSARKLTIDGRPLGPGEQQPTVTMLTIDPRYFQTVGLNLVRGRVFTEIDGSPGQENAIVNARFVQMYFPNEDPLGRRMTLAMDLAGGAAPPGGIPVSLSATIVGVAPNIRQRNFQDAETDPIAYLPFRSDPRQFLWLLARSDGDPSTVVPLLREEVRAIDPDLPLYNIRTLDQNLAQARWPFRVFGTMFAVFALIALMLSAIGLYAITAYSVTQRTQEIGIRTALGAESKQVMWLFVRRAAIHLAIGLTIGIAGAFGVGQIFSASQLLIQTSPRDPITIGSIAVLLALVSIAASLWPARRATKLDPLIALRRE